MEERLGRLLSMTAKAAREAFDQQLNEVGSSLTTYLILLHTAYYPDLSQRELAGHLGIEGSTLTRQLDRLVADGLVRRGSHARTGGCRSSSSRLTARST